MKASLIKRLVSLCFICVRKHDKTDDTYSEEETAVNEIIDEITG